ncbi:hypothetical protein TrVE_jg1075 [Triparma verrucosa]|uniref:Uncharacterized protein n=1 Tax=Triparma verrucosa TaxID=1606542 RepID=A0A9W7B5N1_9STRA|nr:hypothetical protein TrVE_jg1075 [Triparma verrucosa]
MGGAPPKATRRRNKDAELQDGCRLEFVHGFGVHGPIRDNVVFVNAEKENAQVKEALLFPVGQLLCLFWADDNEMSFFQGSAPNVRAILSLSLAPSKKMVAVCEQCGPNDGAQCSVYFMRTKKRVKTVIYPKQSKDGNFTACCFTGDSQALITIAGSDMIIWDWMSQKVKHTISLGATNVSRVSCPPTSISGQIQITTSGKQHLRIWSVSGDAAVKPVPIFKEHEHFVDHCWLNTDGGIQRMAAVTEGTSAEMGGQRIGTVLLFQSIDEPPYLEYRRTMTVLLRGSTRIETIAASSRGFILGGNNGFFSVYEKTDDRKDPYMHIKTFYCGKESFSSICCNHNDEQVVAFSKNCRLLSFPLGSVDMIDEAQAESSFLDIIPGGSHEGSIINTSVCAQKPLLATVGSDRTVRIWNYIKWHCELAQDFHNDEPTAVALHPTGTQVLVALRERIRLYNIMVDELKQFRELPVKGCRELTFCNGGHMFACCLGISISVYSTYEYNAQTGFQNILSVSGHLSPVKRVLFSPDDSIMYSCGMDGNVWGWNVMNPQNPRIDDINMLNKPTSYTGMVAEFSTKDGDKEKRWNRVAVCGTENYFVELSWQEDVKDSYAVKNIVLGDDPRDCITCLALSKSKKYLFAGTSGGNILSYDWPLDSEKPLNRVYRAHQYKTSAGAGGSVDIRGITSMEISHDDSYLFSTAEDGTVFVIGLQIVDRGLDTKSSLEPDIRQFNMDAVFVSIDEVDERKEEVSELQKKLLDLKSENEYELHNKESMWQKEFKELTEERETVLVAERNRYESLQDGFDHYKREQKEKFEIEESNHLQITQEQENQFEHKLAVEMERFDRLAEEIEAMQQKCEGLLESQAAEHERQTRALEQKSIKQEKQLNMIIQRMKEDAEHNEKMYREVLDQQEDEYEKELQKLMAVAEADLKAEQDSTRRMQAIVQTLNTKRAQLKKKNEELKVRSQHHELEFGKEKARREKLDETLKHNYFHLQERENALGDKEKMILHLRSTNRTLDNFRYVLDHRLQQLMKERGPISKHIEGLEQHVRSMYDELVIEFNKKKEIDRALNQKELKIKTMEKEITGVRNSVRDKENELSAIKRDLTAMVGTSAPKELEAIVKEAYRKFVRGETSKQTAKPIKSSTTSKKVVEQDDADEDSLYGGGGDSEGKPGKNFTGDEIELAEKAMEAQRQTKWMQKTAKDLKRRLDVELKASERNQRSKLHENTNLVTECNNLRRENVSLKRDKETLTHSLNEIKEKARRRRMLDAASVDEQASMGSLGMGSVVEGGVTGVVSGGGSPESMPMPLTGQQMRVSKSLAELHAGRGGNLTQSAKTLPNLQAEVDRTNGRVSKGSRTRNMGTALKEDNAILQKKLDQRTREMEMQRIEITKMRDQLLKLGLSPTKQKDITMLPNSSQVLYRNMLNPNQDVDRPSFDSRGGGSKSSKLVVSGGGKR